MIPSTMRKTPRLLAVLAAAAAAVLWTGAAAPVAADGSPSVALLEQKAPSVVCLKIVAKLQMNFGGQSQDQEQKLEIRGAMVDPSGLVMLEDSSAQIKMISRRFKGVTMTVTPTSIQVLFGNEAKEHEAVLVARDTILGLAFVQIVDLEGRTPSAVDLSAGAEPKIGQALFGVSRLPRGFDCAPELQRLYVSMPVTQPRPMWGITGHFSGTGLPAYDAAGKPVGVLTVQEGSEGADEGGRQADAGVFLLPLSVVNKSIAAAKKRVPEALEKAKAAKAAAKEPAPEAPPAMTDEPKPDQPPR